MPAGGCVSPAEAGSAPARRTRCSERSRSSRRRAGGCATRCRGVGVGTSTRSRSLPPAWHSPSKQKPKPSRTGTLLVCSSRRMAADHESDRSRDALPADGETARAFAPRGSTGPENGGRAIGSSLTSFGGSKEGELVFLVEVTGHPAPVRLPTDQCEAGGSSRQICRSRTPGGTRADASMPAGIVANPGVGFGVASASITPVWSPKTEPYDQPTGDSDCGAQGGASGVSKAIRGVQEIFRGAGHGCRCMGATRPRAAFVALAALIGIAVSAVALAVSEANERGAVKREQPAPRSALRHHPSRATTRESITLGRSVDGRRIGAVVIGSADAPASVLVVGCVHGNELAGIAVADRIAHDGFPP